MGAHLIVSCDRLKEVKVVTAVELEEVLLLSWYGFETLQSSMRMSHVNLCLVCLGKAASAVPGETAALPQGRCTGHSAISEHASS